MSNRYWNSERDPDFPREYYDSSHIIKDYDFIIEYQPIILFLIIGKMKEIEKIQKFVNDTFKNIHAVKTSSSSLEILSKGVSKGNAITKIYPNSEIYAIGDSENDYSMFAVSKEAYFVGDGICRSAKQCDSILEALIDIKERSRYE